MSCGCGCYWYIGLVTLSSGPAQVTDTPIPTTCMEITDINYSSHLHIICQNLLNSGNKHKNLDFMLKSFTNKTEPLEFNKSFTNKTEPLEMNKQL